MAIIINAECKDISNDVISDISEVGTVIVLKVIGADTETPVTEKDAYAKFYKQTKNSSPNVTKEYQVNALVNYNPAEDVLKSSGLDEKCTVMLTVATLQLINVGLFSVDNNTVSDINTELKRGKNVTINGALFSIKNVGLTSMMNGYPIICNLGCELYV